MNEIYCLMWGLWKHVVGFIWEISAQERERKNLCCGQWKRVLKNSEGFVLKNREQL